MSFVAICTRKRMPVYRDKEQCTPTLHGGKYICPASMYYGKMIEKRKGKEF